MWLKRDIKLHVIIAMMKMYAIFSDYIIKREHIDLKEKDQILNLVVHQIFTFEG